MAPLREIFGCTRHASPLYLQGVRAQIEDVRAGMLENVDKVLERGEKIEVRTHERTVKHGMVFTMHARNSF